jgi:hypothetical protein
LIQLVISILLWFFPYSVAKSIIRPEIDRPVEPIESKSMLTIFVIILGLYFFYNALIDSIYWLTAWNISSQYETSDLSVDNKSNMIGTIFELLISISLIIKAKSLSIYLITSAK